MIAGQWKKKSLEGVTGSPKAHDMNPSLPHRTFNGIWIYIYMICIKSLLVFILDTTLSPTLTAHIVQCCLWHSWSVRVGEQWVAIIQHPGSSMGVSCLAQGHLGIEPYKVPASHLFHMSCCIRVHNPPACSCLQLPSCLLQLARPGPVRSPCPASAWASSSWWPPSWLRSGGLLQLSTVRKTNGCRTDDLRAWRRH